MENDDGRKRIKATFAYMVENMSVVDNRLADHLYTKQVISNEEYQRITSKYETTQQNVRDLLHIMLKKEGPEYYRNFCDALKDSGSDFMVDILAHSDISGIKVADLDEVDSGQEVMVKQLVEQNGILTSLLASAEEHRNDNKKLKTELDKALNALKDVGFIDTGFVNMFLFPKTEGSGGIAGDWPAQGNSFPGLRQMASAWEKLTACRLTVDCIHYVFAVVTKRDPPEPFSSIASSLRGKIDGILAKRSNVEIFQKSLHDIDASNIKGYAVFAEIIKSLFADTFNWGRVISWLAFSAYLAQRLPLSITSDALDLYASYNWYYLDQYYSTEIHNAGGWNGFVKFIESAK